MGVRAGDEFESRVLDRWRNLKNVRRFVAGWLTLVTLLVFGVFLQFRQLGALYLTQVPVSGGTFREGLVGEITNMNPIFATSPADRAAVKLLFSTLFKYDTNNKVVGDLAESYSVNADGTIYTVKLRKDVRWHDGQPFDGEDVVFTYEAIQHPDTRSYLHVAWRDIKVQLKDQYTVTFALPNTFAPFIHSLTQGGIIPKHILGDLNPSQLRGHEFNTDGPVGTGPFTFGSLVGEASKTVIDEHQLRLDRNMAYHLGQVQLDHFVLSTYSDREEMIDRFTSGELAAIGDAWTNDRERLLKNPEVVWHDLPLNNITFVFLKDSEGPLKSKAVRQALAHAISPIEIQRRVDGRYASVKGPILAGAIGYDSKIVQKKFNLERANKLLEKEGWKYRSGDKNDGYRYKGNTKLTFSFVTQSSNDYPNVAQTIQKMWEKIGVSVNPMSVSESEIQQNHISPHNYDALLFGIEVGADPDPFVYWHSSQGIANGFNLSEVEDPIIDESLESGRTRMDLKLREVKYKTFLEQWVDLTPAIALYQPAYGYIQRRAVAGYEPNPVNTPEDRFNNVYQWQINTVEGNRPY